MAGSDGARICSEELGRESGFFSVPVFLDRRYPLLYFYFPVLIYLLCQYRIFILLQPRIASRSEREGSDMGGKQRKKMGRTSRDVSLFP